MIVHSLIQGSGHWHAYRATHFNASDAPAMLGVSPYKTRTELLHERATGIVKEIDAATQARFDNGHRFEALARPLAEEIVGGDLYPVTGSLDAFSASFDGLTIDESIAWEHKSINDEIRAACDASELGIHLRAQMEQQLMISGAEKCLFLASAWDANGELIEEKHFWYSPDLKLRQQIVDGWKQFEADLAAYVPKEIVEKPIAAAMMQLPALAVQIRGEVTLSNLPQFKAAAEQFIAGINTDLKTDNDFADAEATVKFCEKAERDLTLTKSSAIAQTASIDDLMRTIDFIQDQLRTKRLVLEKLVKSQKEVIKTKILGDAKAEFVEHIAALELEIKSIRLVYTQPDFAGAMKNKRTLASLNDAVATELARAKIMTDAIAKDVRAKLAWCKEHADGFGFLFSDLQQLIQKPADDFELAISTRIADHKKKQADQLEADRKRIQEEERVKAEAKVIADQQEVVAKDKTACDAPEDLNKATAVLNPSEIPLHKRPWSTKAAPIKTISPDGLNTTANSRPNDGQIIEVLALHFRVHELKIVEWLLDMDLQAASESLAIAM